MKVILNEDIKGTGKKGDIVEVSNGFARNFLLKHNKAMPANQENINERNMKLESDKHHNIQKKEQAIKEKNKLKDTALKFKVKTADTGKIFGSITSKEICKKLEGIGITIDKKNISLKTPIKKTGIHYADVKFYKGILGKIKIDIDSE